MPHGVLSRRHILPVVNCFILRSARARVSLGCESALPCPGRHYVCACASFVSVGAQRHVPALPAWRKTPGCSAPRATCTITLILCSSQESVISRALSIPQLSDGAELVGDGRLRTRRPGADGGQLCCNICRDGSVRKEADCGFPVRLLPVHRVSLRACQRLCLWLAEAECQAAMHASVGKRTAQPPRRAALHTVVVIACVACARARVGAIVVAVVLIAIVTAAAAAAVLRLAGACRLPVAPPFLPLQLPVLFDDLGPLPRPRRLSLALKLALGEGVGRCTLLNIVKVTLKGVAEARRCTWRWRNSGVSTSALTGPASAARASSKLGRCAGSPLQHAPRSSTRASGQPLPTGRSPPLATGRQPPSVMA